MPRLLLIITLPVGREEVYARIAFELKVLGCEPLRDGVYHLDGRVAQGQALRDFARQCASEGGGAWLMAEQPSRTDGSALYAPLVDRSEHHAASLQSWRSAQGPLPQLAPGEMVHL